MQQSGCEECGLQERPLQVPLTIRDLSPAHGRAPLPQILQSGFYAVGTVRLQERVHREGSFS